MSVSQGFRRNWQIRKKIVVIMVHSSTITRTISLKTASTKISGHKTIICMLGSRTSAAALSFPTKVYPRGMTVSSTPAEDKLLFKTREVVLQEHDKCFSIPAQDIFHLCFLDMLIFLLFLCIFLLFRLRSQPELRSLIKETRQPFSERDSTVSLLLPLFATTLRLSLTNIAEPR